MGQESRQAAERAAAVRVRAMRLAQSVDDQLAAIARARARMALLSHALLRYVDGKQPVDVADRVRRTVEEARSLRFEVGTEEEAAQIAQAATVQLERLEGLAAEIGLALPR